MNCSAWRPRRSRPSRTINRCTESCGCAKATFRASRASPINNVAQLNESVQEFQEAQQLLPQSPDPAFGLARVYVALRDVDKAALAFNQAEANGFQLGKRERRQLADALSRPRQPNVVGRGHGPRPAAGEGADPAGGRRLSAGAGFVPEERRMGELDRAHQGSRGQPGEREYAAAADRAGAGAARPGRRTAQQSGRGTHWIVECVAR